MRLGKEGMSGYIHQRLPLLHHFYPLSLIHIKGPSAASFMVNLGNIFSSVAYVKIIETL